MTFDITADFILPPGLSPHRHGQLVFEKDTGTITGIETQPTPDIQAHGTTLLTPGLINTHTHLEYWAETPFRLSDGEDYADWILRVIAHRNAMTDTDRLHACRTSILEAIKTGTTCVNDISSDGLSLAALSQVGMRGLVSLEFFNPSPDRSPHLDQVISRYLTLHDRYSANPLLTVGLSPHSPHNVTPEVCAELLQTLNPPLVHTHLLETAAECAWFSGNQPNAIDRIHQTVLGQTFRSPHIDPVCAYQLLWDSRWVAAHGVYCSPKEWQILAQAGVGIAHCPRSNHIVEGHSWQQLPPDEVTWAFGTDSRLSAPSLDLRAEARTAMAHLGLSAEAVFCRLTQHAAQVIKQHDRLGQLASGYQADMVLWWSPESQIQDPYTALLSPQTQVIGVWIAGRMVLEREPDELVIA